MLIKRMFVKRVKHKGVKGIINYNKLEKNFYGKTTNIPEIIEFEGDTIFKTEANFKKIVEEYLHKNNLIEVEGTDLQELQETEIQY